MLWTSIFYQNLWKMTINMWNYLFCWVLAWFGLVNFLNRNFSKSQQQFPLEKNRNFPQFFRNFPAISAIFSQFFWGSSDRNSPPPWAMVMWKYSASKCGKYSYFFIDKYAKQPNIFYFLDKYGRKYKNVGIVSLKVSYFLIFF